MYKFSKKQKIIIGIILAILSMILIYYVYSRDTSTLKESDNQELEISEEESSEETKEKDNEIVVHIAGAGNTEGVIFLKEGDRISSAIEKAGGTTEEADMSRINLAYELEDGMKIYIPKKGEKLENEEVDNTQEYLVSSKEAEQETLSNGTEKKTSSASEGTKTSTSKVNINKATQSELETLPGIGPSTASKIIAYREENKKFNSVEDIKNVSRNW